MSLIIPKWNFPNVEKFGFFKGLDRHLKNIELVEPSNIQSIKDGKLLVVISDYNNELKKSFFDVYGFLIVDLEDCSEWEIKRQSFRKKFFPDDRRMSFKNLNDNHRKRALIPFLEIANNVKGNLIIIAIDRKIKRITSDSHKDLVKFCEDRNLKFIWKKNLIEHLLRIVNINSFLISGFSKSNQNIFWFSDEDKIAPNKDGIISLTEVFGHYLNHYLNHNVGHIKCGTMKSDVNLQMEDLNSIVDLSVGGFLEFINRTKTENIFPKQSEIICPPPSRIKYKSKIIMEWVSKNSNCNLKKILMTLRKENGQLIWSKINLHF